MRKLFQQIASTLQAIENCKKHNNTEWENRHNDRLLSLVNDYMPSGSGIDAGTVLDESSRPNRLVFLTSYHHMNDGFYDGWTDYKVIVTPSLVSDFEIRITGRDKNDTKEYLYQIFEQALNQEI